MARNRNWTVPVESERPEHWVPDTGEPVSVVSTDDDEELLQEALNLIWVLKRFGGAVGAVAIREELAPEIFETRGIAFQWESYAPTKRLPREQREQAPPQPPAPAPAPPGDANAELTAEELEQHFPAPAEGDGFDEPLPDDDPFGDGEVVDETRIDASEHGEADPSNFFDTSVPATA